ncbi:uncharacterized protein LOC125759148 [Rhipicephalus sanguineus]|uniref:uncharacterized protein LOC125759148 n=1 Tax=Rhipicephalus sanguineus TaxID=34632 RepID=UPI0020C2A5A2|nr:uncharacterized protein LOC125759148 [Rhipicephalus sanguineus]
MQQTTTINIDPNDYGIAALALPLGFAAGDIRHLASTVPALVNIVKAQIVIERQASARRESCYICALFTLVTMAITVSICIFLYLVDVISSPISTVIVYVTQQTIQVP